MHSLKNMEKKRIADNLEINKPSLKDTVIEKNNAKNTVGDEALKNVTAAADKTFDNDPVADAYDVDAIINLIGYCKFNIVPFFFVLSNMVITVSNIMIVSYSVWIPPGYIQTVCNGKGETENSTVKLSLEKR